MATYHADGTNDYVPGESNDRAVTAPAPEAASAGQPAATPPATPPPTATGPVTATPPAPTA